MRKLDQSTKRFLDFNGKSIYFLAKGGVYWIAIKPICEALNIQYVRQFKNLKAHPIFRQLLSEQTMVGADGKARKMASLPERYVYGWIFQIRSESKELNAYQKQCCDILFDYFHGSITSRETLIKEKTRVEVAMEKVINSLRDLPEFQELTKYEGTIKKIKARLRDLDTEIQKDQLELFKHN